MVPAPSLTADDPLKPTYATTPMATTTAAAIKIVLLATKPPEVFEPVIWNFLPANNYSARNKKLVRTCKEPAIQRPPDPRSLAVPTWRPPIRKARSTVCTSVGKPANSTVLGAVTFCSVIPSPLTRTLWPPAVTTTSTGELATSSNFNPSREGPRYKLTWPETGPLASCTVSIRVGTGALMVPVTSDWAGPGPLTVCHTTAPATTTPAIRAA